MRLVIDERRRDIVREAALEAAFEANDKQEISYSTEELIKVAVEAAIDKVEELLV